MTVEHQQYRTFGQNMRRITGLGATEAGSLPDNAHLANGGYHVGVEDIQRVGRYNTDYSTRQARDRLDGTNWSSGFDIGDDWPRGGRAAWLRWNNMLLNGLINRDPALTAIRAINVSRDGVERKRYDTNNRSQGLINSTDGVTYHTHGESWRDQIGTAALDRAFRRIEQMADAAVRNVPLGGAESGDEDMSWGTDSLTQGSAGYAGQQHDTALAFAWQAATEAKANTDKLLAEAVGDKARDEASLAAINGLVALITAGGGDVDSAPIIAEIRAVGQQTRQEILDLQESLEAERAEKLALQQRLSEALGSNDS